MFTSLRRLAVAGCAFSAIYAHSAALAAGDSFTQPIQYLPKINLLQTVTHISNGLGKKDVEPKTISRTDHWRFVMASTAKKSDEFAQNAPKKLTGLDSIDSTAMAAGSGQYYINRTGCMAGLVAQMVDERRSDNKALGLVDKDGWGANEFCMRVLEVSADTEKKLRAIKASGRQPHRVYDEPDKGLLEPYVAIVRDKGIKPSEANAKMAVSLYLQTLHKAGVAEQTGKVAITLTNGQELALVPGVAFDVAFTNRVQKAYDDPAAPLPAPTETLAQVTANAEKVFRNQGITLGGAERSGDNYAIHYLNRNRQVAQNEAAPARALRQ